MTHKDINITRGESYLRFDHEGYGAFLSMNYVEPVIEEGDTVNIIFPKETESIELEFLKGFLRRLVRKFGKQWMFENLTFTSHKHWVKNRCDILIKELYKEDSP